MTTLFPITHSWTYFPQLLEQTIQGQGFKEILEIGAGPNPTLTEEFVRKNQLNYTVSDIDLEELNKGDHLFEKRILDFAKLDFEPFQRYDLIFSKMVLEHIQSPQIVHQNIYRSLKPGGVAIHFFASLYGLPSIANVLFPEWISSKLLFYFQKRNPETEGKFPAYYRWCFGPNIKNTQRFERIGFEVVDYRGYLGHTYFDRFKWLRKVEQVFNRLLLRFNSPFLTSNAIIVLKKNA